MTPELRSALGDHFAQVQERIHAPELAFGVRVGGETVAGAHTSRRFRIASMTKSFTAAAVLLLRDRGALTLDRPIADLVPELRGLVLPTTDSPAITVRHLLTMSAGFASDDPWGDRLLDIGAADLDALLARGATFATPPGTAHVYSNYGYAMLGRAITNVAGMTFQRFITAELLEPLGMMATTWDVPDEYAPPHRVVDDVAVPDTPPPLADGGFGAMGGLWTTVEDLLRWTDFMLDAFPPRDDTDPGPLRRSSRREMQQVQTMSEPSTYEMIGETRTVAGGYGMGLRVATDSALGDTVGHGGGLPGYGSNMVWHRGARVAVVSLANVTYAPLAAANVEALDILRGGGVLMAPTAPAGAALSAAATALVELVNDWDDRRADALFAFNVGLDDTYTRRASALRDVVGDDGPLTATGVSASNAARAIVRLRGANDAEFELAFSLSPEVPPRVQWYELTRVPEG